MTDCEEFKARLKLIDALDTKDKKDAFFKVLIDVIKALETRIERLERRPRSL